jgi:exosome complex RNA-binding protein Rrp4
MLLSSRPGMGSPQAVVRSSATAVTPPGLLRNLDATIPARGLGSPSAQPALVIALSERYTPRAQDVVCGDGVEIEVGQRKRKDEGLRREG